MTSSKRAVASVEEHEVGTDVVGDIKIGPAVVVQVDGDDAQPPAVGSPQARGFGHVGEGSVAVIPVQIVPGGRDRFGRAVDPDLGRVIHQRQRRTFAVAIVVRQLPEPVVGDVKVEVSVAIEVEEGCARGPAGRAHACRRAGILKRPVAIVAIEDIRAVVAEEHVLVAVVINIADRDPMAKAANPSPEDAVASSKRLSPRLR